MVYIWLAGVVVFLVIDFITYDMVTVWFALGSFLSMIMALFWDSLLAQIILFVAASALTLLLFRKKALEYLNKHKVNTNVDSLIGLKIKLLKSADNMNAGEAKLSNGVTWTVITNGETLLEGEFAEIVKVSGNKLIVKKFEEEQ